MIYNTLGKTGLKVSIIGFGASPLGGEFGTIEPGWTLTEDGEFSGVGEHIAERGGPVQEGEVLPARPAAYEGTLDGDRMQLTVTLTDSAQVVGRFDLRRGADGQIVRCL